MVAGAAVSGRADGAAPIANMLNASKKTAREHFIIFESSKGPERFTT